MFPSYTTRFRKAEGALRFFFRLRELLSSGHAGRLVPGELPNAASRRAANAIDDYDCIGWSMRGLDEVDLWLLGELYGPTCFGERRRKLSSAFEAGQREFPMRNLHLRQLSVSHRRSVGFVESRLRTLKLIPPANSHDAQVRRHERKRVRVERAC